MRAGAGLRGSGVRARLAVLGRQGSGKGTQGVLLAEQLRVPHVSTGELLRAEIAAGTRLGAAVADAVAAGVLVDDELMLRVVSSRLGTAAARADGYLLDGYPRTLDQARSLFDAVGPNPIDLALELHVTTDAVLPRLAARRVCRDCGATSTALPGDPPTRACELCGGTVARRDDDTEEAILRRLAIYEEESAPLLAWLDQRGLLVRVDGSGPPDLVFRRVRAAMEPRLGAADLRWRPAPTVAAVPASSAAGGGRAAS